MDMTEKPLPFNPPSPSSMQLDALSCRSIIRNMNLAQNRFFIASGFRCLVLIAIFAFSGPLFPASGQNAAPNQTPTPEQQAAKVKGRWSKALNDARLGFQNSNDHESADFITGILDSLERPGGMAPTALASELDRMKSQVRELVRRGAMESAASLNHAQIMVSYTPDFAPPPHPNHKTGGTPGPGGLVLYLPFDKPNEDGVVHDESGAGNDGHVFGAQWIAEGRFGGAYHFSLTNFTDRIVIPNSDSLNPDYITIAARVKGVDHDGIWHRIMDKDCWHGYCLSFAGDGLKDKARRGKLQFEGQAGMGSDRVIDDNRWHHVAATFDGQKARCCVDGVESSHQVRNPGPLKKTSWDLCLGNSVVDYGTGELLAFDGLIDELRIYNRALSATEIKMLATATRAGVDVIPAPSADSNAKPAAAERLKNVKGLYDQGLINKEDYDKKVKEIMDSL